VELKEQLLCNLNKQQQHDFWCNDTPYVNESKPEWDVSFPVDDLASKDKFIILLRDVSMPSCRQFCEFVSFCVPGNNIGTRKLVYPSGRYKLYNQPEIIRWLMFLMFSSSRCFRVEPWCATQKHLCRFTDACSGYCGCVATYCPRWVFATRCPLCMCNFSLGRSNLVVKFQSKKYTYCPWRYLISGCWRYQRALRHPYKSPQHQWLQIRFFSLLVPPEVHGRVGLS